MSEKTALPTKFLPAERASPDEVQAAFGRIASAPMFRMVLDLIPDPVLILNRWRQVVYGNQAAARMLCVDDAGKVLGLRPGEAMRCIHSDETSGGCGTTEFCRECGAPKAILAAQQGGQGREECRISTKSGDALDLRIWASDFFIDGDRYTAYAVTDTSHEVRRRVLERIFFHDILNTAFGLQSIAALFREASPEQKREFEGILSRLSDRLIDEIASQRELMEAESNELKPSFEIADSKELVEDVAVAYRHHDVASGKTVRIDAGTVSKTIRTDKTLLRRVLGNMTKNALEASKTGETVTLGCGEEDGRLAFWVHNPKAMPREVQLQLFQRSFSTKGAGRGLGTYSMKLLTERYLKGTIDYSSEEGKGTRFTARYPIAG